MKTIGFLHYRVGERDGVSLEIEKRAEIFKKLGYKVIYIAGSDFLNRKESFIIDELGLESSDIKFLQDLLFGSKKIREDLVQKLYFKLEDSIYEKLYKIFAKEKIDLLFVHNVFSHALNLPATTGLLNVLDDFKIPTIALHHDFWFERKKYLKSNFDFINYLLPAIPPKKKYIVRHQVINSLAKEALYKKSGIKAQKIGDYFDFVCKQQKEDFFNKDFRKDFNIPENDILVLHATRIVERKAIENAIIFTKELSEKLKKANELTVGNRKISNQSKAVLFMSNFPENDSKPYYESLVKLAKDLGVRVIWAENRIALDRQNINGKKQYSFWDPYVFADIVTYTSIQEGFGNQFLEAVYYKKPIVLFEYPVYKADIKSEGYEVISLGDKVNQRNGLNFVPKDRIEKAAEKSLELFNNPKKLDQMVDLNFKLAQKNHDISLFVKDIDDILDLINRKIPSYSSYNI